MNSARRFFARSLLSLALPAAYLTGLSGDTPAAAPAPAQPAAHRSADATAGIRPEGRLRKLHLVRPDLIPYPIAYEVYC